MTESRTRFGLVLPHFGLDPKIGRVLDVARQAEQAGFDSLWVRDRLVAGAPHGMLLEARGTTFFEPLTTLAAVAAVTDRVRLGTAVLLPNRHPLRLIQDVGTLWTLSGGRLVLGLGLGVGPTNFNALGLSYDARLDLFLDTVGALRAFASGAKGFTGRLLQVEGIEIDPVPGTVLPIYYGGVSRAAVRRAVEHADGWIAGRLPRDTFRARMALLTELSQHREVPLDVATMPITLVDEGDGRFIKRAQDAVEPLATSAEGARDWVKPPSGEFSTLEDLAGLLIAGSPKECAAEVLSMLATGVNHVIFDLRLGFDAIESQVDLLARSVLSDVP